MELQTKDTKTIVVHTQKVAGYLMLYGCRVLGMEPSRKNPERNVFYFADTDKAQTLIKDYTAKNLKDTTNAKTTQKDVHTPDNRRPVRTVD